MGQTESFNANSNPNVLTSRQAHFLNQKLKSLNLLLPGVQNRKFIRGDDECTVMRKAYYFISPEMPPDSLKCLESAVNMVCGEQIVLNNTNNTIGQPTLTVLPNINNVV